MSGDNRPVVILGAGLAGLTAATYLRRHGVPVVVYEAGKNLAGLARSERDDEGFTYDAGAHFITNRLAAAVGLSSECRVMPRYGETVWHRNRSYSYPFGLMRSPRYAISAATCKFTGIFRRKSTTATEYYQQSYGKALANEVALPLTESWSGVSGSELAASIGEKFATGLPRMLILKTAARLTGRTVAIGYSGAVAESPHVWHVYPEGGIGAVCERLADEVRGSIHTESPVEAIVTKCDKVVAVQVKGQEIAARAVISTAPVHILAKLIRGSDRLQYLSKFAYRAMVFVNIRLNGPSDLPDVVTWTPSNDYPFFRISDIGMGLPWLVPEGKTQITCDIGCRIGDDIWKASEGELLERCLAGLEKIVPGIAVKSLGCRVIRVPMAYPVFRLDYEEDRRRFEQGTSIDGLISVGRNGEFAHILMEDVFWRTRRKLLPLVTEFIAEQHPRTIDYNEFRAVCQQPADWRE